MSKSTTRPSGGKKGIFFRDKFTPSFTGTTIRLLPGDYTFELFNFTTGEVERYEHQPHFCYTEHFDAMKKRGFVCSGGPLYFDSERRTPCRGCDLRENDIRCEPGTRTSSNPLVGVRNMSSFNVLDMSQYHEIEQLDAAGNIARNPATQKPYTLWVPCEGRGCKHCLAGKKSKMGHSLHWPMGKRTYNELLEYTVEATKTCASCKTKDAIEPTHWICSNPDCEETFIDMSITRMSDEEIQKITDSLVTCPRCGKVGVLKEIVRCKACNNGVRTSIFDVNLGVRKVKLGEENTDIHIMIPSFSAPCPIDPVYASEAKPLDLASIYAPADLELQSKLLGLTGGSPAQGPQTRGYSR